MKLITIPPQYRVLIWALVFGAIVAGVIIWQKSRENDAATERAAEQGVRTDQAASGIAKDAGETAADTARVEVVVRDAREAYQRGYDDAKQNDPVVRDWADQPVPQRLRDLARARRVARERSGCAGDGCPVDDGAPGQ